MTTVSCPKCRDQVSVPASAPRGARVRCPLCQEEYDLADALAQLPPALIIVSTGVVDEPVLAAVGGMDAATGSHIGSELDRGFDSHLEGGSGKGFSTSVLDSEPSHAGMASAPAPSFRAAPRPKRKEKSMVGELVKIVLGGVVGIGLAIVILWWVAGVDLGLAPTIAKVSWMRWVLPQKILEKVDKEQGNKEVNPDQLEQINTDDGKKSSKSASDAGSETKKPKLKVPVKTEELDNSDPFAEKPASGIGELKIESPIGTKPSAKTPEKTKPATSSEEPSIDDPFKLPEKPAKPAAKPEEPAEEKPAETSKEEKKPAEEKPVAEKPKEETPKEEKPKEEPKDEPKEEKPAEKPAEPTEAKETPTATGSLAEGIDAANTAVKAFDETDASDKEARKTAVVALYNAYAGLGRTVEQANLEDADNAEKLPALRQSLAQAASDPLKLNSIGFFAVKRLDATEGDSGILLAGKVKDFKAAGGHFETTLELARDKRTVIIVSSKNPQDSYEVNDQILILGAVVRDPKEKLAGYKGDETVVVKSGHAMVLPPPKP